MHGPKEKATEFFDNGYSCSQSVLMAFGPQLGLTENEASRVSSAFGAGIARSGETCGAVSGSLMVLGLKFSAAGVETKEIVYQKASTFLQKFQAENGSVKCKQLIDYDISQPKGLQAARDAQVFKTICPEMVRSAAEILSSILEEEL